MARYSIAAVIGFLYVVCAAWVVHSEGQAHRDALRQSRELAARPAAPDGVVAPPTLPPAPALAGRDGNAGVVAQVPAASQPAEKATTTPPAAPHPAAEQPEPPPPERTKDAPKVAERPPMPRPPDPWTDLAKLTADDEKRLGMQINQMILTFSRRLDSGPGLQRVVELGRPLLETCARKDVNYTFTILESEEVFAFSHPGGYIYVSSGMFDLIGEDEDYALEFVIGHEIAHVDLKHALKQLEGKNVAASERGLATIEQFYLLIGFGYPEEQEFEADAWIYQRMRKRDRTVRESLAFLRKFQGYAKSRGFENGRRLPPEKSDAPAVENHFRAHPAVWDRLGRLKAAPTAPVANPPR